MLGRGSEERVDAGCVGGDEDRLSHGWRNW